MGADLMLEELQQTIEGIPDGTSLHFIKKKKSKEPVKNDH